jgi:hypothetical protein
MYRQKILKTRSRLALPPSSHAIHKRKNAGLETGGDGLDERG